MKLCTGGLLALVLLQAPQAPPTSDQMTTAQLRQQVARLAQLVGDLQARVAVLEQRAGVKPPPPPSAPVPQQGR